jgi:DDE superfamily endonuclease
VYAEPYDPKRPKVHFDEASKQLIAETRTPLPTRPGHPARYDYDYARNGTRNLLRFCEPQAGWRPSAVTDQRTTRDCASQMQWLVAQQSPEAEVIRVILDTLNTPTVAALYEAFAPAEARRLARKLACHYTPKHGRWLNMAEIEWRVLQRQCLDRQLPDEATLLREVMAYEDRRNAAKATIDWRFSVDEARGKLHRLYPSTSA